MQGMASELIVALNQLSVTSKHIIEDFDSRQKSFLSRMHEYGILLENSLNNKTADEPAAKTSKGKKTKSVNAKRKSEEPVISNDTVKFPVSTKSSRHRSSRRSSRVSDQKKSVTTTPDVKIEVESSKKERTQLKTPITKLPSIKLSAKERILSNGTAKPSGSGVKKLKVNDNEYTVPASNLNETYTSSNSNLPSTNSTKSFKESDNKENCVQSNVMNTTYAHDSLRSTPKLKEKTPQPLEMSYNNYEISMLRDSDNSDDDSAPTKPVPQWASGLRFKDALLRQLYQQTDPREIFGKIKILPHEAFGSKKAKILRSSSAIWFTPDRP